MGGIFPTGFTRGYAYLTATRSVSSQPGAAEPQWFIADETGALQGKEAGDYVLDRAGGFR